MAFKLIYVYRERETHTQRETERGRERQRDRDRETEREPLVDLFGDDSIAQKLYKKTEIAMNYN